MLALRPLHRLNSTELPITLITLFKLVRSDSHASSYSARRPTIPTAPIRPAPITAVGLAARLFEVEEEDGAPLVVVVVVAGVKKGLEELLAEAERLMLLLSSPSTDSISLTSCWK